MDGQFIILDGKQPTHRFKDGIGAKTWDEAKGFPDVAMIVPAGWLVLDFDDADDAEIMLNIVTAEGLKTKVVKTTRGIHCWFKLREDMEPRNGIKSRLAIGLTCDKKCGGRNAYVKIKQDGQMRKVLRSVPLDECVELPRWLDPVAAPLGMFNFKDMGEGSGRNQALFNYVVYLQSKGFDHDEVRETLRIVNDYVLAEPLEAAELETICRDEAFRPQEEIDAQIAEREAVKGFKHNEFGDMLIKEFNIVEVNGVLYVYDDGYYQADDRIIENKMISLYPSIKQKDRNEVLAYLRIKCHVNAAKIQRDPYVVNLENTRLNIIDKGCMDFSPEHMDFARVPVTYDPSAYCAALDKTIAKVFCGDRELMQLFDEMVGYCLIGNAKYHKAFLLYGSGSNGKSTILAVLRRFLGVANYSTISLEGVGARFATAELENKLANIGDDIDNVAIRDAGTLKKLFSGDALQVERKNERPYTLVPTATHIYSCNAIPRSFDKSDGFYRRWVILPFNAKFSRDDPDYDPLIEEKLTTPEAMSHLLNRAIVGAQRLVRNNGFTEPAAARALLESYIADNSTVLTWLGDAEVSEDAVLAKPMDDVYAEFATWCKAAGIKSSMVTSRKGFYKEVRAKFGLSQKAVQRSDKRRYFAKEDE